MCFLQYLFFASISFVRFLNLYNYWLYMRKRTNHTILFHFVQLSQHPVPRQLQIPWILLLQPCPAKQSPQRVHNSRAYVMYSYSICLVLFDMVELMLTQKAQIDQTMMHDIMLQAIPPMSLSPPGGLNHWAFHNTLLKHVNRHKHLNT